VGCIGGDVLSFWGEELKNGVSLKNGINGQDRSNINQDYVELKRHIYTIDSTSVALT
jgi:hypothetical protein